MDPDPNQSTKKLAEIRKQLTPGDEGDFMEPDSDDIEEEDDSQFSGREDEQDNSPQYQGPLLDKKHQQQSKQPEDNQDSEPQQNKANDKQESIMVQQQCKKQRETQINQPPLSNVEEKQNNKSQCPPQQKKENKAQQEEQHENKNQKQSRMLKSHDLRVDSKIILAISYLFWDDIRQKIPPNEGFIKCHPNIYKSVIKVLYYDEQIGKKAIDQIERYIEQNIQIVQIDSKIGECGIQYSKNYRRKLRNQGMLIFADNSSKKKERSYYICGRHSPKDLLQEASKLKNKKINFKWFNLFSYPNSRSYKKILSNFFALQDFKDFITDKFNAKNIEIAYPTLHLPIMEAKKNYDKGITCVLTFHSQNKLSIHQEIQEAIKGYIEKNYWLFCFTFIRQKNQQFSQRWSPKMEGAHFFFIDQRKMPVPLSYLFIIVKKIQLNKLRETIIKEIEGMSKVKINGRRFFNGFQPRLVNRKQDLAFQTFPKIKPYSQSIWARKGQQFDWKRELEI